LIVKKKSFTSDLDVLQCLKEDYDYAVISLHNINKEQLFTQASYYSPICLENFSRNSDNICYLRWYTASAFMIKNDTSIRRRKEIYNTLDKIDKLFGNQKHSVNTMFTLYGPFESQSDALFFDSTDHLIDGKQMNVLNSINSAILMQQVPPWLLPSVGTLHSFSICALLFAVVINYIY